MKTLSEFVFVTTYETDNSFIRKTRDLWHLTSLKELIIKLTEIMSLALAVVRLAEF